MAEIKPPKKLYRYRRTGPSLAYTLKELSGDLWCAYAKTLNDPFDGLAKVESEVQNHVLYNSYDPDGLQRRGDLEKDWAIASFSETWDSPTMWAHYADNYSGVCFVYNSAILAKSIQSFMEIMLRRVDITAKPDVALLKVEYVEKHHPIYESPFQAARTKTKHWSYEREWRIISQGFQGQEEKNKNGAKLIFDFAIESVIYGSKTDASTIKVLKSTIDELNSYEIGTKITLEALWIDHLSGVLRRDAIV